MNKIEGVFKYKKVHFFDALVGYFRASGYFRIRKFIQQTPKIRFLVGINVDKLTYQANQQGLLFNPNAEQSQEEFFKEIKKDIQEARYDKEVEDGMYQFIEDIMTHRIEMRIHPKQNIHAKIYIFREEEYHPHGYGSVITGSSNLTEAGLEKNFEFNVELRYDDDILFATETFEKLWEESVEIDLSHVDKIKRESYLNTEFTPYQLYLKFLLEYFGKSIDFDPNSISDLPKGYKKLSYQVDAVNDGYAKMMKHNGFFLSDVVGLGKTVVAALIAKKFFFSNGFPTYRSHTLIIVPPALKESWEDTLSTFKIDNYKIITNGSLHKIKDAELFDLVIVDEAHKFRTDTASMYNELQKICKTRTKHQRPDGSYYDKKIILVSATPLNNRPEDIANLVYLFQDSKDSTLEERNLQRFFRIQIDRYRKLKKEKNIDYISKEIKEIYEKIRVKVVEPLTVRRTRTDLMENEAYRRDLEQQGVVFPEVHAPEKIYYPLDEKLNDLYDRTINILSNPQDGLTYFRYQAIKYLRPEKKKKYKKADVISVQLATIMKTLLVKRIDSSFYAFKQSLKCYWEANHVMLQMFENGTIYIAPNLKVNELLSNGKEEELIRLIDESIYADPTIEICTPDDFEDGFREGIEHDEMILKQLVADWENVKDDPKLDIFLDYLKNKLFDRQINQEGKLLVFSESKETTRYLLDALNAEGFTRILAVRSDNRKEMMPVLEANFDANYKGEKKNDYDIIISTEVLAEGVNLHRANIIVNYDTPWNSTRLMQRIGRVNRIGSTANDIYIYNFFPTYIGEAEVSVKKISTIKIRMINTIMGSDTKTLTDDEKLERFNNSYKNAQNDADQLSWETPYINDWMAAKNTPEFKEALAISPRTRIHKTDKSVDNRVIVFGKQGSECVFKQIFRSTKTPELITAEDALPLFKSSKKESSTKVSDAFDELYQIIKANLFTSIHMKNSPQQGQALAKINVWKADPNFAEWVEYLELLTRAIEIDDIQNYKPIKKAKTPEELSKAIPMAYLQRTADVIEKIEAEPADIILTEELS